ncbi:MAG: aminotransferase [Myxococcota bacterium]|nr:aminotransferase [Myxococcota bacterium]
MTDAKRAETLDIMDRRAVLHPNTPLAVHQQQGGLVVESGQGVMVRDVHGKSYLDSMAGLWCVNVGYGNAELGKAAADEMANLGYYHTFAGASNPPQIELADRLLHLLREEGGVKAASRVFFGLSGSDANDTHMKLIRYYNNLRGRPEKKKIIAREGAYHGLTLGSASLTGIPVFHKAFDLPLDGVVFVSTPHHYRFAHEGESEEEFAQRLADELEATIEREGPDTVAAFIAEPVMGAGGVMPPPRGYFDLIQPILRHHDILFIADEVICGFGRLGSWFGSNHYDLQPDLISMAKGLTSGYFPLSAAVISEEIWSVLESATPDVGIFAHGFTYTGHPVGAAVAMANLDIIERDDLVGNASRVGPYFHERMRAALGDHAHVGEIRGEGLIMAVEIVKDRGSKEGFDLDLAVPKKIVAQAAEEGLIARAMPTGHAVGFSPPLCITKEEVDRVVEIFSKAVDFSLRSL